MATLVGVVVEYVKDRGSTGPRTEVVGVGLRLLLVLLHQLLVHDRLIGWRVLDLVPVVDPLQALEVVDLSIGGIVDHHLGPVDSEDRPCQHGPSVLHRERLGLRSSTTAHHRSRCPGPRGIHTVDRPHRVAHSDGCGRLARPGVTDQPGSGFRGRDRETIERLGGRDEHLIRIDRRHLRAGASHQLGTLRRLLLIDRQRPCDDVEEDDVVADGRQVNRLTR